MTHDGIKITDLRPEVMTLVNSDPVKYDPNNNGKIDGGNELSQLLSEYQCIPADLTANDGKKMWSLREQKEISERGEENSKNTRRNIKLFSAAAAAAGLGASAYCLKKGVHKTTEQVKFQKLVDVEKLIADGSYTPGARSAADVYSHYTGKHFMKVELNGCFSDQKRFSSIQKLANSQFPTYNVALNPNGTYVGLRDWKPGDPQFVKQTKLVDDYKTIAKTVYNAKWLRRAGLIGAGTLLACGLIASVGSKIAQNQAENKVKLDIKAAQSADGEKVIQERIKHEKEIQQQKAALKKEELEYKERLHAATGGIENNLKSSEARVNRINAKLTKINQETDNAVKTLAPKDSTEVK